LSTVPAKSVIGPAIAGGIVGALLTVALLFALPGTLTSRLVRSGMLADPAILNDTVDALRDQQYAPVLEAHRAALEKPFASSWKGAAKPDVILVEFFDYACPYCKASNADVARLVAEDKGLRVVYRELPILGPDSVAAARLSMAASQAGRFNQFHDALYQAGKPGAQTNARAAAASGIAPEPRPDPRAEEELKRNFDLAGKLGATGTPLFIVGDRVLNGAVGYEQLKAAVAKAREKG
jgi:protein-disulfide isomerase